MKYNNYIVTAEVQSFENWSINEDGQLDEWIETQDSIEITGYTIVNNDNANDVEFVGSSEMSIEELRGLVDAHINEIGQVV